MSRASESSASQWLNGDIVVLRWPEQQAEAVRLADEERPYLLLVEQGAAPPDVGGCLVDWVRLPVDDADIRARLTALERRAARHPTQPTLHTDGTLIFRGRRAFLSPLHARISAVLVDAFESGVAESDLFGAVWPEGGRLAKMRVHISRLRKDLVPLGLEITAIRNFGYRLHAANHVDMRTPRSGPE